MPTGSKEGELAIIGIGASAGGRHALKDLLAGRGAEFDLPYACDSPTQSRDFLLQARRVPADFEVLVSHLDLSGIYRAISLALQQVLDDSSHPSLLVNAGRPVGEVDGAIPPVHPLAGQRVVTLELDSSRDDRLKRRLTQFASNVAHEMNNVLAAVMSTALTRLDDVALAPAQRRELEDIVAACRRGRDTTRNLLGFARPSGAKRTTTRVDEVVGELLEPFRASLSQDVAFDYRCEEASIVANRSLLGQAVLNLLVNARDAIDGQGRVTLSVTLEEHTVTICVEDDGRRMPETTRARASEPFFSTKGERVTGLGLALVERFVKQGGGVLQIESAEGRGTTVSLRFPAARDRRSTPPALPKPRTFSGDLWLVDDDRIVGKGIARTLARLGFSVTWFESGAETLEAALTWQGPRDAIFDYSMLHIEGIELRNELQRHWPSLKVVMMSGHELHPSGDSKNPWIWKPFEVEELVVALATLGIEPEPGLVGIPSGP